MQAAKLTEIYFVCFVAENKEWETGKLRGCERFR